MPDCDKFTPREMLEIEVAQMRADNLRRLAEREAEGDRLRDEERDRLRREEERQRWPADELRAEQMLGLAEERYVPNQGGFMSDSKLKTVSVSAIEAAIAKVLEELTGEPMECSISNMGFEKWSAVTVTMRVQK